MKRVKRRTFSGVVCEQEVYNVGNRTALKDAKPPRPRFKNEEERERHKIEISRRRHALLFNENFSPASLYSTLTFDADNEVHDARDCRKIRDLYIRRLKYAFPDAVIFCYFGQGKTTHRFHLHMVSNGVPEEAIREKWGFGDVCRIENLRKHCFYDGVDHGQDYTGLANYLFDHWRKEFGGHRWKQTKNARKPDREKPTLAIREYSEKKPPVAPRGYILVETKTTKYGYMYFKYVRIPEEPEKRPRRKRD